MNIESVGIYQFQKKNVRVIFPMNEDEPWFVASEIGKILGFQNISMFVKSLDDDERLKILPNNHTLKSDLGLKGYVEYWIVSESGLYQLLMRSNKPIAQDFQRWLRKTVLPGIRKGEIVTKSKVEVPIKSLPPAPVKTRKKGDPLPAEKLLRSYEAFKELIIDLGYGDDYLVKSMCLAIALINNPDIKMPGVEKLINKVLQQGNYDELITVLENCINK